jgi:hypothetical protein
MTSSAPSRRRLEFTLSGLDLNRLAGPALVIAVVASGLLIYHLTRGSSFLADDWRWIIARRGNNLHTFLAPYNWNLSLVPIAIYRLMFAVVGIGDFAPYRILLLVVASATGVVIFEYARHRIGEFCAVLVATLLLFLGPGWNDIMQPFQIAWLIAVASGILALSLLDRRRTRTDAFACLLILISISSTSVGVAFAVGIAVDIAVARRRWRDAWIAGLPLLLYAAWAIHYHPAHIQLSSLTSWPANLAKTTGAGVAGVVGLSGVTPTDTTGLALTLGGPLLVLAVAVAIVRIGRGWDWTRFVSLAAVLVTFSLMTTVARFFQSPLESRYIYVTCVLVTLMFVELARGRTAPFGAQLALAALTLVAVVSNIGVLRAGGGFLRQLGTQTDAVLAAVDLDRHRVAPDARLTQLPYYPLIDITAGQYFNAERALGTPAYTVAELEHSNAAAQAAADAQSLADGDVKLAGVADPAPPRGTAAPIDSASGGVAVRRGACAALLPAAALAPGQASTLALQLNPGTVSVTAGAAPVTISVRRFAPAFTSLGTVRARGSAIVSASSDRAPQPWHVQVQSLAPVRVCSVSSHT